MSMPFGLIFGGLFYGLLVPWLGFQYLALPVPWAPARPLGVVLVVLGLVMAVGLMSRQGWARWSGALTAVPLALLVALITTRVLRGPITEYMGFFVVLLTLFLAAVLTTLLLLVPGTGDVRRGLPADAGRRGLGGRLFGVASTLAIAGFLGAAVWALSAPSPAETIRPWKASAVEWQEFGPALEAARVDDKLVFVDFFAEWCGPCKKMDRTTFRDPEVARLLNDGEVVAVRVDSEETVERHGYTGYDLAETYDVMSYPTVALLDAEGKVIARRTGFLRASQLREWLEEALKLGREKKVRRMA
jgi:thiol-disulfide isomerase/thioredoxin